MTARPPRVTVIIVTERTLEDQVLLRTIQAVEQQTYPRQLVDVSIIRNVESYPDRTLRMLGAKNADTDWVAFLDDDDAWPEDRLDYMVKSVGEHNSRHRFSHGVHHINQLTGVRSMLVERDYYLTKTGAEL